MAGARSNTIDVLKALAALLIINSHLESFHLRPWMAADGMFGNSIFFFTTGFTLVGSLQRHPDQKFGEFMWKRLSRLYPGLWIVMLLLPPEQVEWSLARVPHLMLYPTLFTFVLVIVPAYPLFFFIVRSDRLRAHLGTLAALLIATGCFIKWRHSLQASGPGFVWGDRDNGPWTLYFWGTMLLGAAQARSLRGPSSAGDTMRLGISAVGLYAIYVAFRVMALSSMTDRLGHQVQSLAVLAMPMAAVVIAVWLRFFDQPRVSRWFRSASIASIIAFLAANTWETYLVHEGIKQWSFVYSARWPFGLIMLFGLTFVLSPMLRRITTSLVPAEKGGNRKPQIT